MLLLLLLCGALVASGAHDDNRLATCQASTHFECGRQIGEQQARRITNTLRTKYAASLAEFISTPTGNELLRKKKANVSLKIPVIIKARNLVLLC